jgi:hypothetical protein
VPNNDDSLPPGGQTLQLAFESLVEILDRPGIGRAEARGAPDQPPAE